MPRPDLCQLFATTEHGLYVSSVAWPNYDSTDSKRGKHHSRPCKWNPNWREDLQARRDALLAEEAVVSANRNLARQRQEKARWVRHG